MRAAFRHALLVAAFAALLHASSQCALSAIVRLKSDAVAASPVVRLADVADIADADPATVKRLGEIALSPAPAPGGESLLDFETIRSRLQAHGVDLARIEFTGSSAIRIKSTEMREPAAGKTQPPQPARGDITDWQYRRAESLVAEAVRQHLASAAPELGQVNVEVRLDREDVLRVLSLAGQGLIASGGRAPWDAWQSMTLRGRNQQSEFRASCRISPRPFVVVARHALPRGHILRPEDLAWRQIEQTAGAATRPEDVVGRETTRTFRPDEPIDPAAIQTVPLIRSNDIVTVYARQPGVTVKRLMKSREDGSAGDQVTLVTLDGRQQIVARVTGYHEAEAIGSTGGDSRVRFEPPPSQAPRAEIQPAAFIRAEGGR